jgi:hypothetical protein
MNTSVKNHSPGYFIGYIVAMLSAFLLLACGGGGGSAGSVPNQPPVTPSQSVASLVITTSSDTLSSSGVVGSEVTVTVLARDKNNIAVSGATIAMAANSGALTWIVPAASGGTTVPTPGVTDATGTVMAKLSTAGAATPRVIALVATSGSATSAVKNVSVVQANAILKIVTSSDELPSAGSITVTVFAKDSTNNVIRNAKVLLSSTSGILNISKDGLTGTDGTIVATLSTQGDGSARDITLTATLDPSVGLSDPDRKVVKVVTAVPTLQITSSGGDLPSSGLPGSEVTINVLVRDGGNNVKANEPITLTTDSGVLSVTNRVSSKEGLVSEKLSVADDPTNRVITVTASANGVAPVKTVINVSGTHIDVSATASVNAGTPSTMTATLLDSSNTPLANRRLAVTTTNGGTVQLSNSGDTGSNGTVTILYTPPASGGKDTILVSALGATGQATVVINRANFSVTPPAGTGVIGTCYPVTVHSDDVGGPTQGTVNLAISRGAIFSDINCAMAQTAPLVFLPSGSVTAYFKSTTPGTLTMTATLPNNIAVQGAFKVTAPLTDTSTITLNVDPSVVSVGKQTTIRAVVRDGTGTTGNLVSGATVNFNILQDNSGGRLAVPTVGITGDDGVATVTYIAGSTPTATNGVIVQGQIQGKSISGTVPLTVGGKSLFLTAGTGNAIKAFGDQGYQLDYQVLVTDAAGNAVSAANITASVVPVQYRKGIMTFSSGFWKPTSSAVFCNNEDKNNNGILDPGEDATTDGNGNGNGRLDPGIPIAVTPTVQTDSRGVATVSLIYARNQSFWLQANLSITAVVAGSETKYVANFLVPGASGDFNKQDVIPPGVISPYGQGSLGGVGPILCTDPN